MHSDSNTVVLAADRSVSQSVSHETMFVIPFWISVHNVCTHMQPSCQSFVSSDCSLSDDTPRVLRAHKQRQEDIKGRHDA